MAPPFNPYAKRPRQQKQKQKLPPTQQNEGNPPMRPPPAVNQWKRAPIPPVFASNTGAATTAARRNTEIHLSSDSSSSDDDDSDFEQQQSNKRVKTTNTPFQVDTTDANFDVPTRDVFIFRVFPYAIYCRPCDKVVSGSYNVMQLHLSKHHPVEKEDFVLQHKTLVNGVNHLQSVQDELCCIPFLPQGEYVEQWKCLVCGGKYSKEANFRRHIAASNGRCDRSVPVSAAFVKTPIGVLVEKQAAPVSFNVIKQLSRNVRVGLTSTNNLTPIQNPVYAPRQHVTPFANVPLLTPGTATPFNIGYQPLNQYPPSAYIAR